MSKRKRYFIAQKLIGIGFIAGMFSLTKLFGDGDYTAMLIAIPVGLVFIFSKKILIVD